ncbi:phosphotransferase [Streptomyces sp. NPDC002742]|uniref:phosphotransferase n=1 Tax=Streptomyces sp. NPDC002742 TaxID=3364663 RepID=UPI003683E1B0
MAEILLAALRKGFTTGRSSGLRRWYHPECTLESFADGRAEVVPGASAVLAAWPRVIGPPGRLTWWSVSAAPGGYEVVTQREIVKGGTRFPVRQLHQLHVESGRIRLHLVSSAAPHEPPALVPHDVAGVVPGSVAEFGHDGLSGAALFSARLPSGRPVVVKIVRPGRDWLAVASRDAGREGLLFTDGVYTALPAGLRSPVLSAQRHDSGWIIVMDDISAELDSAQRAGRQRMARDILTAAADMHAGFLGRQAHPGLCTLADRLRVFSPLQRLLNWRSSDNFPTLIGRMWETFAERADPKVSDAVLRLVADPSALLTRLGREAPSTLLHGDLRPPNLGVRGCDVLAIDWGLATYGPGDLDFVYFLCNSAWGDDEERDALEEMWLKLTDSPPGNPVLDLAVVYHAVAGELGVLLTTAAHRPEGLPRPSDAAVAWWMRRVRTAFDRLGDLA